MLKSANRPDRDPIKRMTRFLARERPPEAAKPGPRRIQVTRPAPIRATRSPAEAGPKSGRKRPKRGKWRLPESRDRREVFLARSAGKLVDRGDKPQIRWGRSFPRLLARDPRSVRSFRSLPNSRERRR